MKQVIINNQFSGGWSVGKKYGLENSFNYSRSLDFRLDPSQLSLLAQPSGEMSGTIVDLIQNEVMTNQGDIYAMGDRGYIYKRDADTWVVVGNIGNLEGEGAYGISYRPDQDSIYFAGKNSVSLYSPISTSPTLSVGFYGQSISTYNNSDAMGFNVSAFQDDGAMLTTIGTSIVEGDNTSRFFQTDISPISKLAVRIATKGTGDWTITLHDGLNNLLGSSTVTNANLTNGAFNEFTFTTPINLVVAPAAQTYHIHITSTVGDGTVYSTSSNDLSTCDLELWANRLTEPINGMHPMVNFLQYIMVGNGNYLSVYEPLGTPDPSNLDWSRHYLQFPAGYEVCGLATTNEYVVIATERVATGDNTPQDGIIFFWDGIQKAQNTDYGQYNFFVTVPEGSPYALHTYKNVIYYTAGGAWYAMASVDSQPQKIRTLPQGENYVGNNNNNTVVYPYAATTRNGIQLMAWPSTTDNENLEYGVYSFGQVDVNFPNSFGYSYPLSTGSRFKNGTNNLTIGMVQNFGDTLHISWRDDDNGGYGLDVVSSSSSVAEFAPWESIIYDMGYPAKLKEGDYINATWLPLPDGVEFQFKYSIDRGDWVYSERFSNTNTWLNGDGMMSFSIGQAGEQARFYEIQIGVDIYCEPGVTESPVPTSINLVYDDLRDEGLNNA